MVGFSEIAHGKYIVRRGDFTVLDKTSRPNILAVIVIVIFCANSDETAK
jgi:hypothetical protein